MSDANAKGDDDVAPWTAASESLRSVVKWIAASFGALGALLIGTAPLGGLHQLNSATHVQDWLVPLGFGAVALGGVGFVVWIATSLLTPSTITLPEVRTGNGFAALRKLVAADPTAYLGLWGSDIDSFMENRITEYRALGKIDQEKALLPSGDPRLHALDEARPMLLRSVEACGKVSARLLAVAGFHDLSRRFSQAKSWMFGAAVLVVIGVIGFTATTPESGNATSTSLAVPALVSLTSNGSRDVGPVLGAACPKPFQAVLLSGSGEGPWQLMVTDVHCRDGTVLLTKDQAVVIGVFATHS